MINKKKLSKDLIDFIENSTWVFAKTYARTWPHEYIIQEEVDNDLFLKLANHIDKFGYEDYFYKMKQMYFEYNGHLLAYGKHYKQMLKQRHISSKKKR